MITTSTWMTQRAYVIYLTFQLLLPCLELWHHHNQQPWCVFVHVTKSCKSTFPAAVCRLDTFAFCVVRCNPEVGFHKLTTCIVLDLINLRGFLEKNRHSWLAVNQGFFKPNNKDNFSVLHEEGCLDGRVVLQEARSCGSHTGHQSDHSLFNCYQWLRLWKDNYQICDNAEDLVKLRFHLHRKGHCFIYNMILMDGVG